MSSFMKLFSVIPRSVRYRISLQSVSYLNGLFDATYGSATRHYHNYDHIIGMVEGAKQAKHPDDVDFDDLIIAIMFHDVVYELAAKPGFNEDASAAFAEHYGPHIFEGAVGWQHVNDLIIATVHDGKLQRPDEQWMADLDLAGLSADYAVFMENSENIIAEYSVVFPENDVLKGRIDFLTRFLARRAIYYSDYFSESSARRNMAMEITRLKKMLK